MPKGCFELAAHSRRHARTTTFPLRCGHHPYINVRINTTTVYQYETHRKPVAIAKHRQCVFMYTIHYTRMRAYTRQHAFVYVQTHVCLGSIYWGHHISRDPRYKCFCSWQTKHRSISLYIGLWGCDLYPNRASQTKKGKTRENTPTKIWILG
jgi:hypothetical protein